MPDVTATEAAGLNSARRFSDILDAVEHHGTHHTIVRRGRPVAELGPAASGSGREIKSLLRRHPVDAGWSAELGESRQLLHVEERH